MPFAVFLDVLGTSNSLCALPDDHIFDKSNPSHFDEMRSNFQEGLREGALEAGPDLLLCASFSDCGYIVVKEALATLHAVRRAMQLFSRWGIPVRGGLGYGNYGLDATAHIWSGIAPITEARFFGSALVHAHRAESVGYKGCRVFAHESAFVALGSPELRNFVFPEDTRRRASEEMPLKEPPATIINIESPLSKDVSHELCCVGHWSTHMWTHRLNLLEQRLKPDPRAAVHYEQTRSALFRFSELRESAQQSIRPDGRAFGAPAGQC